MVRGYSRLGNCRCWLSRERGDTPLSWSRWWYPTFVESGYLNWWCDRPAATALQPTPPSFHDSNEPSTTTINLPPDTNSGSPNNRFEKNRSIRKRKQGIIITHGGVSFLLDVVVKQQDAPPHPTNPVLNPRCRYNSETGHAKAENVPDALQKVARVPRAQVRETCVLAWRNQTVFHRTAPRT